MTTEQMAPIFMGHAVLSTPSLLINMPAAIHASVPITRMAGNSAAGSFIWLKEMVLVSASVGM